MSSKKYFYVYVTTDLTNGKSYIGSHSSNDLNNNYLGSGSALSVAIKEHGQDNFQKKIIAIYDTRELAYLAESHLLNDRWFATDTYNLRRTTSGLISHSKESKIKMSQNKKGENNPMFGKPSPNLGKGKTAISKLLISQSLKGKSSSKRMVKHKESGTVYSSIKEASDLFEIKYAILKQQLVRGSLNCEFEYYNFDDNESNSLSNNVQ